MSISSDNQKIRTSVPRVVIAGTNSGCGKTTLVCALLKAFQNRGLRAGAFKCGPDYIDPMFHSKVTQVPCSNLDSFFFDPDTLNYLLAKNGAERDINVIEGVMGYYDGRGFDSMKGSTFEIAQITQSPVILVVNARGAALSVLAEIYGFLKFHELMDETPTGDQRQNQRSDSSELDSLMPENPAAGVIFNQCTGMTYQLLKKEAEKRFPDIKVLGYLPVIPESRLESRHLGLVTAQEVTDLQEKVAILAQQAQKCLDLDGILELSREAAPVRYQERTPVKMLPPVRIGVARDNAFCFYYEDSLQLLRDMGAELVPFSPLEEAALPEALDGIYLGGGYPELYAENLSRNRSMRQSIRVALEKGIPCIAECGGFMYLTEAITDWPMVEYLKGRCFDTEKLHRFGYVTLTASRDNLLCRAGERIPAHEFHYWEAEDPGQDFRAVKPSGKEWACVHASEHLYAGFPHFHFYANPKFAERFFRACLQFRQGR